MNLFLKEEGPGAISSKLWIQPTLKAPSISFFRGFNPLHKLSFISSTSIFSFLRSRLVIQPEFFLFADCYSNSGLEIVD